MSRSHKKLPMSAMRAHIERNRKEREANMEPWHKQLELCHWNLAMGLLTIVFSCVVLGASMAPVFAMADLYMRIGFMIAAFAVANGASVSFSRAMVHAMAAYRLDHTKMDALDDPKED